MNGRDEGMEKSGRLLKGRLHEAVLTNRETASFTGVTDVEAFNDEEIVMQTELGGIVLAGSGLHITRLSLDEGVLEADGRILAVEYLDEAPGTKKKGVFSGLFK